MWILRIFKESLNGSFDYFLRKVKGRFWSFLAQMLLSYLAVAILTLVVSLVVIALLNQGQFSLNLFSFDGLFAWMRMVDPAWTVTIAIASNYFFTAKEGNQRMSFMDFYTKKSSSFWLELLVALVVLAIALTIYYKNELLLTFADQTPFELLLSEGGENLGYTFSSWLSSWIYYLVLSLPIIAVVIIETRERKRNGVNVAHPVWQMIVAVVLLSFILSWTFDSFLFAFNDLFLKLIYIPFEMIEIPAILGIIAGLLFKLLHFMMLAAVVHFTLNAGANETRRITNQDILDEI